MLLTSLLTPDKSVANQFFLPNFFWPQNIFLLKIVAMRKKIGRECCQPIFWPKICLPQNNRLATLSSGVGNTLADEIVANQFFAKKYFFSRGNNFEKKKYFVAKKLVGNTLVGGWQHSRRGSTMTSTTSIGCQIHSFDATKMVCTKK